MCLRTIIIFYIFTSHLTIFSICIIITVPISSLSLSLSIYLSVYLSHQLHLGGDLATVTLVSFTELDTPLSELPPVQSYSLIPYTRPAQQTAIINRAHPDSVFSKDPRYILSLSPRDSSFSIQGASISASSRCLFVLPQKFSFVCVFYFISHSISHHLLYQGIIQVFLSRLLFFFHLFVHLHNSNFSVPRNLLCFLSALVPFSFSFFLSLSLYTSLPRSLIPSFIP